MKQTFYKIRRGICRWIIGFDNCPSGYRYDPWRKIATGLTCLGITFGVLAFFFLLLVCL